MKSSGISYHDLISSLGKSPAEHARVSATIDAGIRLAFISAAIALKPALLKAAFEQIEKDTLDGFKDHDDMTKEAIQHTFSEIKESLFKLNRQTFEKYNNGD